MTKPTVSTAVSGETERVIEKRSEEQSESKSDSVRYFLQKGIEADRQPATDGGRVSPRFSFIELMVMTLMLASAMTAILSFGAAMVPLKWVLALLGATTVVLAVYFGQKVYETSGAKEGALSR